MQWRPYKQITVILYTHSTCSVSISTATTVVVIYCASKLHWPARCFDAQWVTNTAPWTADHLTWNVSNSDTGKCREQAHHNNDQVCACYISNWSSYHQLKGTNVTLNLLIAGVRGGIFALAVATCLFGRLLALNAQRSTRLTQRSLWSFRAGRLHCGGVLSWWRTTTSAVTFARWRASTVRAIQTLFHISVCHYAAITTILFYHLNTCK